MNGVLFVSDDGVEVEEGDPIFIQAKDCGFYALYQANQDIADRKHLKPDRIYGVTPTIVYWNYWVNETNAIDYKSKIINNNGISNI